MPVDNYKSGMENKTKKVKLDTQLVKDLWSENDKLVLKAIQSLRSIGNIHYLTELFRLLNQTDSENVEKELVRFLADIKDPAAMPVILAGLRDPALKGARGYIVSACWQSGMDYSHELELFIRLFMEDDYLTALECFTVIEEAVVDMEYADIEKLRKQMLGGLEKVSEEKKPLARELLKLLEI